jgi:hypothetical protein
MNLQTINSIRKGQSSHLKFLPLHIKIKQQMMKQPKILYIKISNIWVKGKKQYLIQIFIQNNIQIQQNDIYNRMKIYKRKIYYV